MTVKAYTFRFGVFKVDQGSLNPVQNNTLTMLFFRLRQKPQLVNISDVKEICKVCVYKHEAV